MNTPCVLAALLVPAVALAGSPAPRGPDFVAVTPSRLVDRTVAVSDGMQPIEPLELVMFDLDSTALDPIALSELDVLARWLKRYPEQRLVLEGHTDRLGPSAYNIDLGKRRAEAVRAHLRSWGISGDRIIVAAFGERGAHERFEDPSDRRVVVFASDRPVPELVAAMLNTRAKVVAWSDHGTTLETEKHL
jgi:outer membrane protein OmpA-like peptidoglycan-associated protein